MAIGSNLGNVLIFKDDFYRLIECKVNCLCSIDIFDNYIALGCEDGSVGIIYRNEFVKLIVNVLKSKIIKIKFVYKSIGSYLTCIVCDDQGESRIVHIMHDIFGTFDYQLQYLLRK